MQYINISVPARISPSPLTWARLQTSSTRTWSACCQSEFLCPYASTIGGLHSLCLLPTGGSFPARRDIHGDQRYLVRLRPNPRGSIHARGPRDDRPAGFYETRHPLPHPIPCLRVYACVCMYVRVCVYVCPCVCVCECECVCVVAAPCPSAMTCCFVIRVASLLHPPIRRPLTGITTHAHTALHDHINKTHAHPHMHVLSNLAHTPSRTD